MNPVKVERKYFDALESLDKRTSFKKLIETQVTNSFTYNFKELNNMDTVDFVNCLQYGYKLKESPKEHIEKLYKSAKIAQQSDNLSNNNWYEFQGKIRMIEYMNETLNLGLNLEE